MIFFRFYLPNLPAQLAGRFYRTRISNSDFKTQIEFEKQVLRFLFKECKDPIYRPISGEKVSTIQLKIMQEVLSRE